MVALRFMSSPPCCTNHFQTNVNPIYSHVSYTSPRPTYWPNSLRKKPDILDVFYSSTPSNIFLMTGNLLEPISHHSAVLLTISASPPIRSSPPKLFQPNTYRCKFHYLADQNLDMKVSLKPRKKLMMR